MKNNYTIITIFIFITISVGGTVFAQGAGDGRAETQIIKLMDGLASPDSKIRASAANKLIDMGKQAVPFLTAAIDSGKNAEVIGLSKAILAAIPVRERVEFSDKILKWYPDIYISLATEDVQGKYEILQKITETDDNGRPAHNIEDDDIAGVIGELLLDGGKKLDAEQLHWICALVSGRYAVSGRGWDNVIPAAGKHIRKLLKHSDTGILKAVLYALINIGDKESGSDILPLLVIDIDEESKYDWDEPFRLVALKALNAENPELFAKNAAPLLKDDDAKVRYYTLTFLIDNNSKEFSDELRALLGDEDGSIRAKAITGLAKFKSESAVPEILPLLKDESREARWAAANAIAELADKEIAGDIAGLLDNGNPDVRSCAIYVLGGIGAKEYAEKISEEFKNKNFNVRKSAVNAICKFGCKEYIDDIMKLIGDKDTGVRACAIYALGELGAGKASVLIRGHLRSPDPVVRRSVVNALGKLLGNDAVKDIISVLHDSDDSVCAMAVFMLGELRAKEAAPHIKGMLKNNYNDVRKSAVNALAKISGKDSVPDILPMLRDTNTSVRAMAGIALVELGSKDSVSKKNIDDIILMYQIQSVKEREKDNRILLALKALGVTEEDLEKLKNQ